MKKSAAALVLTGVAAAVSTAFAAGFQLTEQSSLGAGRAYAGAGIVGDDLSAVHYNPAGMTLLDGTRFQAGGVWIGLNADFKGNKGESENGRLKGQMIPAGYVTHQVNDKVWLGFAMTVPFGMGTEYSRDWKYANRGTSAKIYTFDMNPSIAYKVSDFISVGAGVSVQYAKAELGMRMDAQPGVSLAHGKVEADSWDWGYNLGVMITPNDKLRFGLAYRSAIEHNADGDVKLTGVNTKLLGALMGPFSPLAGSLEGTMLGTAATIKTPDTVMLTGTWEATDKLRLSGLVRWANWSNFDDLTLNNDVPAGLSSVLGSLNNPTLNQIVGGMKEVTIENKWQDTWLFSVGADYRINDAFTIRGGLAYETSPIDDQSTRMAVIPDTDRVWFSLGGSWYATQDLQFDIGATYLMGVGDKDLYCDLKSKGGKKVGKYDSLDAYLLGVQMQYRF
ncbi:MAG TPA: TonB-dependent receptor [Candidatus Aphodousia faecigallinarum]|uniref:TonB-dependent receptor n=1 Tax=Candidatus Aphodousia faecigallinarum TaxID=2840677 RepID=A0A9D1LEQ1_9BURK|nr:TonB-dependent receptor [Candidatus Aphodousia faecigallinarum]